MSEKNLEEMREEGDRAVVDQCRERSTVVGGECLWREASVKCVVSVYGVDVTAKKTNGGKRMKMMMIFFVSYHYDVVVVVCVVDVHDDCCCYNYWYLSCLGGLFFVVDFQSFSIRGAQKAFFDGCRRIVDRLG